MTKKLHKLLFILYLFNFSAAFADNKIELKTRETSQLDQIHEALEEFTRFDTKNNIIYPSLDPSIFELKYPNQDIKGRIV